MAASEEVVAFIGLVVICNTLQDLPPRLNASIVVLSMRVPFLAVLGLLLAFEGFVEGFIEGFSRARTKMTLLQTLRAFHSDFYQAAALR